MFSSLKDALAKRRHTEEQSAARKYHTLIDDALGDKLTADDAVRVDKVLKEAGRTFDQFEQDIAARRECRRLESLAENLPALEEQLRGMQARHETMTAERDAAYKKSGAELDSLHEQIIATSAAVQRAVNAKQQLAERFAEISEVGAEIATADKIESLRGTLHTVQCARRRWMDELTEARKREDKLAKARDNARPFFGNGRKEAVVDTAIARLEERIAQADRTIAQVEAQIQEQVNGLAAVAV